MSSSVRALTAADHFGSLMPEYPAFLSYTRGSGVHLAELGYCGVTEEALRAVVEKHVKTLLERSEGQITVAELEQTLITAEGPLMRDLLQVLVDQRQQGAFPPSAPDDSST
jgi:hypothetical protein